MNENWVKILETIKDDEILKFIDKKFNEKNIKYKIDLKESWEGSIRTPKYIGKFVVYVSDEFKNEAEKILDKYYEKNKNEIINMNTYEIDDDTEMESKKRNKKQKIAIKIYLTIVVLMVISIIIAGLVF